MPRPTPSLASRDCWTEALGRRERKSRVRKSRVASDGRALDPRLPPSELTSRVRRRSSREVRRLRFGRERPHLRRVVPPLSQIAPRRRRRRGRFRPWRRCGARRRRSKEALSVRSGGFFATPSADAAATGIPVARHLPRFGFRGRPSVHRPTANERRRSNGGLCAPTRALRATLATWAESEGAARRECRTLHPTMTVACWYLRCSVFHVRRSRRQTSRR
jgi:hypothetical protein